MILDLRELGRRTSRSAWRRLKRGRRIYFGTLAALIESLEEAHAAGRLKRRLKTLMHPALLVVDEIGYLPVTSNGARAPFRSVATTRGPSSPSPLAFGRRFGGERTPC